VSGYPPEAFYFSMNVHEEETPKRRRTPDDQQAVIVLVKMVTNNSILARQYRKEMSPDFCHY
jgi:hypothetical protein